ncbi:MAG: arabinan endo-1,5-alpha-L-arabinosidase [Phenylobacterium sp.]
MTERPSFSTGRAQRREMLRLALASAGLALLPAGLRAQDAPAPALTLSGDITPIHDPCIIREDDAYYLFCTDAREVTGGHLLWRTSKDLTTWTRGGFVTPEVPAWALAMIPGARGIWAPDISFVDGRYRLYYALSTFGSNRSAIGLFTNRTLDPAKPGHRWVDEGLVLASERSDDFNAIDPNFLRDRDGGQWLAFGSFWSGLKLRRLDPATGKPSARDPKLYAIASRPAPPKAPGAIEAPFLIERGGYYYLFASYDYCCKGVASSYYMVVGRSRTVRGPYLGQDGGSMLDGLGTVVLQGARRWRGPGHNAVLRDGDKDYLVYHAYDAEHDGANTLRISPIRWTADGWPTVAG